MTAVQEQVARSKEQTRCMVAGLTSIKRYTGFVTDVTLIGIGTSHGDRRLTCIRDVQDER